MEANGSSGAKGLALFSAPVYVSPDSPLGSGARETPRSSVHQPCFKGGADSPLNTSLAPVLLSGRALPAAGKARLRAEHGERAADPRLGVQRTESNVHGSCPATDRPQVPRPCEGGRLRADWPGAGGGGSS